MHTMSKTTSKRATKWIRSNRGQVEKRFGGAIKSAITAHGPITEQYISSATKRIYKELLAILKESGE